MADALISFLLDQLATVSQDEIQLVVGVEHESNKLTKTFEAIQVVLKDADHKQFKDDLVKHWLEEFKDVAYDMDDILDEWNTEMLIRSQIKGIKNAPNDKGKKKVHSFLYSLCSCFRKIGLHHDIVVRIKNIRERERVESIASEKDKYHLNETKSKEDAPECLETSSLIDESVVQDDNPEFSRAVQAIIQMLNGVVVDDNPGWHAFHKSLSKSVEGSRFLLVLDDVRNDNSSIILHWPFLLDAFKSGARGSKVLVTTRSRNVTNIMNTSYDHDLDIYSDDDC